MTLPNITPLPDAVWDNKWYPLSGPPQTMEETKLLQDTIAKEKAAVSLGFNQMKALHASLHEAAQLNCSDIALTLRACTMGWKMFRTLCADERIALAECTEKQGLYLTRLGFLKAENQVDRARIVREADAMFLESIKASKSA